jgi:hypothetical protein
MAHLTKKLKKVDKNQKLTKKPQKRKKIQHPNLKKKECWIKIQSEP